MKRKSLLFILLIALLAPLAMNGQTQLLNENFDSMSSISTSYLATGWYAYNAGNGKNWTLNTDGTYSNSGSKSAQVQYHSSNPANCYLISKPFSVSSDMAELSVSLYEAVRGSSFAETFEVFFVKASDVTTLAGVASATKYSAIASDSYTNTTFAQKTGTVTNSALAGQSVRVVVHCTSKANMWYLYIDDITVSETVPVSCDPYTLPYTEGFEGDGINCWTGGSMNTANSIGLTSEIVHGGTYAIAFSSYNSASNYNQYLISPELNTNDAIDVSFYYTRPSSYGDESFRVGYSTTTNDISAFTWEYDIANTTVTDWTLFKGIMPAGTKYVAINYYSNYQYYLVVDDFSFTVSACAAPTDLTAEITGNAAELSWTGTQESYNVRYRKVFMEGFEEGIPSTWITIDSDGDGNNWLALSEIPTVYPYYTSTVLEWAHSGNNAVSSPSYANNVGGGGTVFNSNQWLISPKLYLDGTLQFYAASTYADEFEVLLSTTGTDISDFTTTLRQMTAVSTNTGWDEINIDLSSYAGQEGYIAIHHVFSDGYFLIIDDFSISGGWTTMNASEATATINNLSSQTTYEFQVKGADCSNWSASAFFTTPEFYVKHIDNWSSAGYYLISSPIAEDDNPTNPENVTNILTPKNGNANTYDLYRFDQAQELEWRNYRSNDGGHFNLEVGKGYLYGNNSNSNGVDLVFTGTAYSGNGEVTLSKVADDDLMPGYDFPDWNLVGNPFPVNAYFTDITRDFYTMNSSGTEIILVEANPRHIEAMEGVFVVAETNGEKVYFTTNQPTNTSKSVTLDLRNGNNVVDRAIVRFGQSRQLPKFQLNRNSTKLYIPQDGKDYAVVCSEEMGAMPVNFKAEDNGTYSMNFSCENVGFAYLHLIDTKTGNDIDLLKTPSYSFEAKTTDYESRFKLVFATGDNSTSDTFAFFSNGSFVINNDGAATLQVIDITGRILKSESINGCANVNVNAAPGVYMLRLVNGDNVKVQKVVVK